LNRPLDVLAVDWDRLRRARPGLDERALALECLRRGRLISRWLASEGERSDPGSPSALALRFVQEAAGVAVHRFTYATRRASFESAARREEASYHDHLELAKDVVPVLKQEAKALKAEVRRVEEELRSRGVDPEGIEPRIDWRTAPAVDDYMPPKFESPAERRRAAVEHFRRPGKHR